VFVAGAPRSGTTLVSQVLIRYLPVSYLTNLAVIFPRSPITATKLFRLKLRNQGVKVKSFYGRTNHLWGPNDALPIWDRWLGRDRSRIPTEIPAEAAQAMKAFFGAYEAHFGLPVVNKNNALNVSAHLVAEILPSAHFICLVREPLYLAQALLVAREVIHGDRSHPYGISDPSAEAGADPIEQVCRQALFHRNMAFRQRERLGEDRFSILSYEQFCADPASLVRRIQEDILGGSLEDLDLGGLAAFRASRSQKLPAADFADLQATLERIDTTPSGG
jgi:hypothetical protein